MTTDTLHLGAAVLARPPRRDEHSRTPGYVGGRTGIIQADHGRRDLPSSAVNGDDPVRREQVYAVSFTAQALFGSGQHRVTVDLYASALEVADVG